MDFRRSSDNNKQHLTAFDEKLTKTNMSESDKKLARLEIVYGLSKNNEVEHKTDLDKEQGLER